MHNWLRRNPAVHALLKRRAASYHGQFSHHLGTAQRILDIGCGPGFFTDLLRQYHPLVVPLDVFDFSYFSAIRPILYDGLQMPFGDQAFDCALLVTTLHHAHDPARVMMEAARVADRLIIVEDVTNNQLHKWLTWGMDNLLNLEFSGNLHNNKSDGDWRSIFADLGLHMVSDDQQWLFGAHWQRYSFGPINQFIYVLETQRR